MTKSLIHSLSTILQKSMASVEVIQFSCVDLVKGLEGWKPKLDVNFYVYFITCLGIFMKVGLPLITNR